MSNKMLDRKAIESVKDQKIEIVEVPEWDGGAVYVRSIYASEKGEIEAAAARFKETKGKDADFARSFTVKFAAMALCDEHGNRIFEDVRDGILVLSKKNAAVVSRIAEAAQKLSGFSKNDLEELEKNSVEAQPDASPTA